MSEFWNCDPFCLFLFFSFLFLFFFILILFFFTINPQFFQNAALQVDPNAQATPAKIKLKLPMKNSVVDSTRGRCLMKEKINNKTKKNQKAKKKRTSENKGEIGKIQRKREIEETKGQPCVYFQPKKRKERKKRRTAKRRKRKTE